MELSEFKATLTDAQPPAELSLALQAMWQDAHQNWGAAHSLAQAQDDEVGAWVHAYLHRVEGDNDNAAYWYRRAGRPVSHQSLPDEWESIVTALLAAG
ncbi:MAG: hypothetical protein HC802_05750 [Caldilineaceae bacterium]|nr:hypothetical protein [Caldilineaceae bacterium]